MPSERFIVIKNREGLHFRPIMKLVDVVSKYSAQITVHFDERSADARSPMELLMLVATQGARLKFVAEGADVEKALDAVEKLIESGFDET